MEDDLNSILSEQAEQPAEQPAQVEAPAQEVQAEAATGEEGAAPAQPQDDPIETHRKGLETAVVAERRKRQEAEQRAQALEARIAEFTRQQQPQQRTEDGPTPPDPAQYTDANQYWADVAEYKAAIGVRRALAEERQRQDALQQQQRQESEMNALREAAHKTIQAGAAEFHDFDAVTGAGLAPFMTPLMQQALITVPNGHKLAYFLGKNPAEAARLAQLPPAQMLVEMGELRAKVSAPKRVELPQTLTKERNAQGQFTPAADIPTLDAILGR